jgi:hypothetical protein
VFSKFFVRWFSNGLNNRGGRVLDGDDKTFANSIQFTQIEGKKQIQKIYFAMK